MSEWWIFHNFLHRLMCIFSARFIDYIFSIMGIDLRVISIPNYQMKQFCDTGLCLCLSVFPPCQSQVVYVLFTGKTQWTGVVGPKWCVCVCVCSFCLFWYLFFCLIGVYFFVIVLVSFIPTWHKQKLTEK